MPEETKPRLKLYHASPSRSSVTMWMLEEVGEPYEIQLLSLKNGDQHKPEYLAVNPMGKVPTSTITAPSSARSRPSVAISPMHTPRQDWRRQ